MVRMATIARFVPVCLFSDSIILDKRRNFSPPPPRKQKKKKKTKQCVTLKNSWDPALHLQSHVMWKLLVHIVKGTAELQNDGQLNRIRARAPSSLPSSLPSLLLYVRTHKEFGRKKADLTEVVGDVVTHT